MDISDATVHDLKFARRARLLMAPQVAETFVCVSLRRLRRKARKIRSLRSLRLVRKQASELTGVCGFIKDLRYFFVSHLI